jgi:hypothetical protein
MDQADQTCFLAPHPLPDNDHSVMSRTLTQAQELLSRILARYDDPNDTNASFQDWFSSGFYQPGTNRRHRIGQEEYSIVEDWKLLEDIYTNLSKILFDDLLDPPGVSWSITGVDNGGDECKRYAGEDTSMTIDPRASPTCCRDSNRPRIMLWEMSEMENRDQRMLYYVELLLHGMIHAFLTRYTCKCLGCSDRYLQIEYKTGHGIVWQQIVHDLERFARKSWQSG